MMHVCSAFSCIDRTLETFHCTCSFVMHRQRVLRAHGEWSEVGGPGPSPSVGEVMERVKEEYVKVHIYTTVLLCA